jgi:hypothetical protein
MAMTREHAETSMNTQVLGVTLPADWEKGHFHQQGIHKKMHHNYHWGPCFLNRTVVFCPLSGPMTSRGSFFCAHHRSWLEE